MSSSTKIQAEPTRETSIIRPGQQRLKAKRKRGLMIGANFGSALDALWANRLRSLLTTLGVVIGVAAVIAVVILTQGATAFLNQSLTALGTNTLVIFPGTAASSQSLTLDDEKSLVKVAHVANVSPVLTISAQSVFGNQNWNTRVQGVYPNYQSIQSWQMARGTWYSTDDETAAQPVAVIGQTIVDNLFATTGTNPIGQTIRINGQLFRVVGQLQSKGAQGFTNPDDVIFVPYSTALSRLKNSTYIDQIQVQVDNANNVNQVQLIVTALLEKRHHITAGVADDFRVRNSNQLVQTAQQQSTVLGALLVGIAAISLSVGGIGIMNIMLVSVTERTREIGIRMAIGARQRDIRNQFLIEALTLSSLGGIIGITLGILGGFALVSAFHLPFVPSIPAVLLAFGVSAAVGVVFGLYPAVRASKLDPIVALRTE
ncbi:MAG TPA: multidrug ABC transporter substrate-binding protein [Ktedonobacter sp.]|jgi:putative ABC transport system permease protein|nr:multidrug ABC transporter substrate-binding protein [Ktedonobacter sp.]HCF85486.1 multidrug ABC transporter substrate-binding protein [Ktedonobacter sp.]